MLKYVAAGCSRRCQCCGWQPSTPDPSGSSSGSTTTTSRSRNPNNWQTGRPYLDGVQLTVISDGSAAATQFEGRLYDPTVVVLGVRVGSLATVND